MDFSDQVVLSYLEEDNIQRAFFRVRPLLRRQGPLMPQQIAEYPDDGYLRIVPDKDEQHTFKERMRSLGSICVLDLRNVPTDANKIRTNKNYMPSRGETNQFIVYSDAVRAVPENEFYEVVTPENVADASTPFVYTRVGGNINGPVARDGREVAAAQKLPPDSAGLFAVTLPSGAEKLFYWPGKAEAPAEKAPEKEAAPAQVAEPEEQPAAQAPVRPVEQPAAQAPVRPAEKPALPPQPVQQPMTALEQIQKLDENLSASTNRLDAPSKVFAPPVTETPKKLAGTPLYQSVSRRTPVQRSHNPLMETVENQRLSARYEAPGAQVVGTPQMRDVVNPVEQFKRALSQVWQSQDAQRQTVDILLQMPGMRAALASAVSDSSVDLTLAAMHAQLQDMEAERLMTLMQIETLKKDGQAAREDAMREMTNAQRTQLDQLKAQTSRAQEALDVINAEREKLLDDRDKVLDTIAEVADADDTLRLAPPKGVAVALKTVIERVIASLKAHGFEGASEDACAMLIAYALSDGQMGVCAPTDADALEAARAFAYALGAACLVDDGNDIHVYGGGDAPCFILSDFAELKENMPYMRVVIGGVREHVKREYRLMPYACCAVQPGDTLPGEQPACEPVQAHKLRSDILDSKGDIPQDAKRLLQTVRSTMKKAGCPLPMRLFAQAVRFVGIAQNLMDGGIAAALDEAILTYAIPYLTAFDKPLALLGDVCAALPRALRRIG